MSESTEQKFHLKYDSMTALFADHVVLNGANGAFILDFASTMVSDPGAHQSTIPVHTRIAMTHQGAAQLLNLLSNAFAQAGDKEKGAAQQRPAQATPAQGAAAQQRPAQGATPQQRPAQGTPAQGTPAQGTPAQQQRPPQSGQPGAGGGENR